jgi:hypothetical protein
MWDNSSKEEIAKEMDYTDIYKTRPDFFESDYLELKHRILTFENTVLASAPGMADERCLDYVAYRFQEDKTFKNWKLITLSNAEFDLNGTIEQIQKIVKAGKKVLVLAPSLLRQLDTFGEKLLDLQAAFSGRELVVLSKLSYKLHIDATDYAAYASLLDTTYTRQPLDRAQTEAMLEYRRELHGWEIPRDKAERIYKLSGGNYRLVKRLARLAGSDEDFTPQQLLQNSSLNLVLAQLAECYSQLSNKLLNQLGIVDTRGACKSELLTAYIQREGLPTKVELPKKLRSLFNLLFENRGKLVTIDQIDNLVSGYYDSSLWASYKLVNRLKLHLKGRYEIHNIRGKGYILEEIL